MGDLGREIYKGVIERVKEILKKEKGQTKQKNKRKY